MPTTEAQRRAKKSYRERCMKVTSLSFYPKDMDLWEYLQAQENITAYVKDLIRRDMAQEAQSECGECDERDAREGSD